ncbi:type IV secretion system protein [Enterobacter asburiae]|uniref:type IV secretion system protein n=1 Tax=Enterobacter asburiae TaxID=61645 RepID=UPI0021CEC60F|nr:type IV secretion system protein [Enterobacter asburiae]MCU6244046.1 type IV secretion system protein [Enterobacter asburiae]
MKKNTTTTDNDNTDPVSLMALRARQEWDERIGSAVSSAKNWRMAAFLSMFVSCCAVFGITYIGSQSKIQPYALDFSGDKPTLLPPLTAVKADQLRNQYIKNIRDFVESSRSVYMDVAAEKKMLFNAYSYLIPGTPAYTQLTQKFKDKDPYKRAETELVKIQITAVLPLADNTWQAEWTETTTDRSGNLLSVQKYKATMNTLIVPPKTREAATANPLGFYIRTFNDVVLN